LGIIMQHQHLKPCAVASPGVLEHLPVTIRSSGEMNSGLPSVVVDRTNWRIACLAGPSFRDGSGLEHD
jgi:hypothetical protein